MRLTTHLHLVLRFQMTGTVPLLLPLPMCQGLPLPSPLTFSNPIFLPTAYSPTLICFGWKRGWWITCNYPTVLKEENIEEQKEYNLRYLLAKVRKNVGQAPTASEQIQQKPCRTFSDIGAEQENHTVGRGST
jgi:hypothetical protein